MIDIRQQSSFSFFASDDTGVYECARQSVDDVEPKMLSWPEYYLKYPLKVGASWDGGREAALKNAIIPTTTTIESLDETVTVPAGTFQHCVKTKRSDRVLCWPRRTAQTGYGQCRGAHLVLSGCRDSQEHSKGAEQRPLVVFNKAG